MFHHEQVEVKNLYVKCKPTMMSSIGFEACMQQYIFLKPEESPPAGLKKRIQVQGTSTLDSPFSTRNSIHNLQSAQTGLHKKNKSTTFSVISLTHGPGCLSPVPDFTTTVCHSY